MKIKKEAVLRLVEGERPCEFRDIMRALGVAKAGRSHLKAIVDGLVDQGKLMKLRGNRYAKPAGTAPIIGRVSAHRDGYGFVTPESGGDDVFIPARYLRENMHGDRVEVQIVAVGRSGKPEGRIVQTFERGYDRVVGTFHRTGGFGHVVPDEQRITRDIFIPPQATGKVEDGQVVVALITRYPMGQRSAEGTILEVLGWPEEAGVEAEVIIRKYGLPVGFSGETLAEAKAVPETVSGEEIARRVDLRDRLTVTIDGESARDFDDAVSIQEEPDGKVRLWVSIADVSYYVRPSSALDAEAFLRGTSVYFPDRCIPMLPEELSNGICSLNPDVNRLTMTAEILLDQSGQPLETRFYPSVIKSSARLTYTLVKRLLEEPDPELLAAWRHLVPDLVLMEELAAKLTRKRKERGSIDFDLPEPEIIIDVQGRTEAIVRAERNVAHRIIEEFMLAANEAVARYIAAHEVPSLYRVHEAPDVEKLNELGEFIRTLGYDFTLDGNRIAARQLQKLLADARDRPEEKLINGMLLRAMKQARYAPDNIGHFGLAADCYTHFTSPIRRYPDLVVHRTLKRLLAGRLSERERETFAEILPEVAAHSSARERLAMEAEREIVQLRKVQFMQDKIGQAFIGYVSGVSPYGLYVELSDLYVEGMVHLSTLPQDCYRFLEKQHTLSGMYTRRSFRIGDKLQVRVVSVSIEKRQIDFVLDEPTGRNESFVSADEAYPRLPVAGKRLKSPSRKKSSGRKR